MYFLIVHELPERTERLVFDLGVKRDLIQYAASMQVDISKRQPIITLPDTAASIRNGSIDPARDINTVVVSHTHWDHIGTPADDPLSRFIICSGMLSIFATCLNRYPASTLYHINWHIRPPAYTTPPDRGQLTRPNKICMPGGPFTKQIPFGIRPRLGQVQTLARATKGGRILVYMVALGTGFCWWAQRLAVGSCQPSSCRRESKPFYFVSGHEYV